VVAEFAKLSQFVILVDHRAHEDKRSYESYSSSDKSVRDQHNCIGN
jgi:hypothetical protein